MSLMNPNSRFSLKLRLVALIISLFFLPKCILAIQTVQRFKPIEIPVPYQEQNVKNVWGEDWNDIFVSCLFKAPDGSASNTNGFYHSKNLWMVRFAPDQIGWWHYQITISDKNGNSQKIDSFQCVASTEPGFIRVASDNKSLYYSTTGKLYSGVGFGDCMLAARDSILEFGSFDGGYRPKGYHAGIEWNLPYIQYLIAYGDAAGFDLYRYSDANCAYSIVKQISVTGNDYDTLHSRWTDSLFYALRQHGFRIYMTILASPTGSSSNPSEMAAVNRYAQYCIDRYGALVDFWELTNESTPDSLWIKQVAGYIHVHDPYHHLVSVSWQQPNHPDIDIISPHWYGKEADNNSDIITAQQINQYSVVNKPVIFGEQGDGSAWDSTSGLRMRGRIWSALFNAGTIIFWNGTFARDCCNQYLGWPERRYVKVMQNFARLLDTGAVRSFNQETQWNVWEMRTPDYVAGYLRLNASIMGSTFGLYTAMDVPVKGDLIWYDVHTGDILERRPTSAGNLAPISPGSPTDIAFIAGKIPNSLITDTLFRLDVNPRTYVLLNNTVGSEQIIRPMVTNIGTSPTTITRGFTSSPSPNASLILQLDTTLPITLQPGQSITVPIGYKMLDTGGTAAMFSFEHSASPAWENIAISATAIQKSSVEISSSDQSIEIFPDPAKDKLTVKWQQADNNKGSIQLFSIDGTMVAEKESQSGNVLFDLRRLSSGIYQINIKSEGFILASKKITIAH